MKLIAVILIVSMTIFIFGESSTSSTSSTYSNECQFLLQEIEKYKTKSASARDEYEYNKYQYILKKYKYNFSTYCFKKESQYNPFREQSQSSGYLGN